ncbi:MAG: sigma-70 family RNA polymerase sigma factor [Acidobacteriota bacterium]
MSSTGELTQLLVDWGHGNREALERLLPLVYNELRRLAKSYLRKERVDHTLQGTALVHEAYLKLIDQRNVRWQNRAHFFGVAAQMIRRILVDHARAHLAAKRGAGLKLSLDEAEEPSTSGQVDLVDLDDALNRLSALDPQQGQIVELRYFGGLSIEETAEVLHISPATVKRDWSMAKAWLHRELTAAG